mgnify:CR=1 FL=1
MEDPSSQNLLLQFVLLFILTVLNAFFSATEMAMVSLNRARVEQKAEEGDRRYIRLLKVLENPNHFLSTIQVGITLITILSGASWQTLWDEKLHLGLEMAKQLMPLQVFYL